jgi:quercetin dioxygenase-like cupin family protein
MPPHNTSIGSITFEPGARTLAQAPETNPPYHESQGFYQEAGKSSQVLHKGDVVRIPPDAVHWHGGTANTSLTHIAISPNTDKGSVVWLKPVTDEEYNNIKVR